VDIYRRFLRREAEDGHYLAVSRWLTVFWGAYAIVTALYAQNLGSLVEAVNRLGSLFYGTLLGVFVLAFFVPRARGMAAELGLTFHVGSQCVDPEAFERAIAIAAEVAHAVGGIDHLDVGGGFPALYKGDEPEFEAFVGTILGAVAAHGLRCRLQCEPGRLLVADGASVLTRVELRRGRSLYLNDGVYGNLAELKWIGPQFPIRLVRPSGPVLGEVAAFDLYGPTCDSIDSMPGPHWIVDAVAEGDWLEVGMMGAYSNALRTAFNGFESESVAILRDRGWYRESVRGETTALAA
jgi:ornithine decarboxylase